MTPEIYPRGCGGRAKHPSLSPNALSHASKELARAYSDDPAVAAQRYHESAEFDAKTGTRIEVIEAFGEAIPLTAAGRSRDVEVCSEYELPVLRLRHEYPEN
ncbi:MAG: hypothetical protein E5Y10_28945 [Mesorhizobium sp.]|uniref:hypothetical protein n=1 Tax=Mesorhizobium sp. TaxID=1871066 RepID=UPI00122A9E8C|nr:hypothetical protein [Mesorhizobium sp.]TIN35828.1 MAG: hypothetical protein E5Y13_25795 [Mesorhizobium sp.]TJU84579.1 MAG: hypothetical protein E5Y10_28945 [Mesorhizobium sp.]